jgi:hypothetical protein
LTIIELKNVEDRYVVQQLTRYYHALKSERSLAKEIDYQQPVRLIAIAPSFHQDTEIDCTYTILNIELFTFEIRINEHQHVLKIVGPDSQEYSSTVVPYEPDLQTTELSISSPSRKLLNWLSESPATEFQGINHGREQILGFDKRIKEVVESQFIIYGKGKTKPCAEIRRQNVGASSKSPVWVPRLFLWLPDLDGSNRTLRMMIGPDESWQFVKSVGYSSRACRTSKVWHLPSQLDRLIFNRHAEIKQQYRQTLSPDGTKCVFDKLVDLSLQTWLGRL